MGKWRDDSTDQWWNFVTQQITDRLSRLSFTSLLCCNQEKKKIYIMALWRKLVLFVLKVCLSLAPTCLAVFSMSWAKSLTFFGMHFFTFFPLVRWESWCYCFSCTVNLSYHHVAQHKYWKLGERCEPCQRNEVSEGCFPTMRTKIVGSYCAQEIVWLKISKKNYEV